MVELPPTIEPIESWYPWMLPRKDDRNFTGHENKPHCRSLEDNQTRRRRIGRIRHCLFIYLFYFPLCCCCTYVCVCVCVLFCYSYSSVGPRWSCDEKRMLSISTIAAEREREREWSSGDLMGREGRTFEVCLWSEPEVDSKLKWTLAKWLRFNQPQIYSANQSDLDGKLQWLSPMYLPFTDSTNTQTKEHTPFKEFIKTIKDHWLINRIKSIKTCINRK